MNQEFLSFKKTLKSHGHFVTKQRMRLFFIMQKHNALTIRDLIKLLPRQDQATVYRNIRVFERLGIITRLQLGWHSKLELTDKFHHHHHHLTCLKCGSITALPEDEALEANLDRLGTTRGFKATDHQLEIRGLCHSCQ